MQLQPGDLKAGVEQALNALLAPIQADFNGSPEFQEIERLAYPPAEAPKKVKKVKKIGSGYPAKKDDVKPEAVATSAEEALAKLALEK